MQIRNNERADCGKTELLNEQRFAQLVATDERFDGTKAVKKILNFAVLVNALRWTERFGTDHLQGIGIGYPIALEAFRLFAVEHGKHNATGTKNFSEATDRLFGHSWFQIIENVPEQNCVE